MFKICCYRTEGCVIDPILGNRSEAKGEVSGEVILSAIEGKGSDPMKESTLTDLCGTLMGTNLIPPRLEGGRSSMCKYSSSMIQFVK